MSVSRMVVMMLITSAPATAQHPNQQHYLFMRALTVRRTMALTVPDDVLHHDHLDNDGDDDE